MARARNSRGQFAGAGLARVAYSGGGRRLTGGSFVKGSVKRNALAKQLRAERRAGKVRGTLGTIQAANRFLLSRKRDAATMRFDRATRLW